MRRLVCAAVTAALGSALLVFTAPSAFADAPTNDSFGGATVVGALPFSSVEDSTDATTDPLDPTSCSNGASVWYSFTPQTSGTVSVDVSQSSYNAGVSAWTGTEGALTNVECVGAFSGGTITFQVTAGTTYHLMVGACCGQPGGVLQLAVRSLTSPRNDNFAAATPVGSIPFSDTPNLLAATAEPGEPACGGGRHTVWYSYTPTAPVTLTATSDESVAIFTGSSVAALTTVICPSAGTASVVARPGTTYYFQLRDCCGFPGPASFHLAVADAPEADIFPIGLQPSIFDDVQFQDFSNDPAGIGIADRVWDFGDGATASGAFPIHRYAHDGDYTVRLTVTTPDGRRATDTAAVAVRTHDVTVVRISAPRSTRVGRTISIDVFVSNNRIPDTVTVDLAHSAVGGFQRFGSLQQLVQVKPHNGTTRFGFTYTITPEDAALGKVSFAASAEIVTGRDALIADNSLISAPPTTITPSSTAVPAPQLAL